MPIQANSCLGGIQLEKVRFTRMHCLIKVPRCTVSPRILQSVGDPSHGFGVGFRWAKVPAGGKARTILREPLGEQEVSAQGFENKLPGPDSRRIADQTR